MQKYPLLCQVLLNHHGPPNTHLELSQLLSRLNRLLHPEDFREDDCEYDVKKSATISNAAHDKHKYVLRNHRSLIAAMVQWSRRRNIDFLASVVPKLYRLCIDPKSPWNPLSTPFLETGRSQTVSFSCCEIAFIQAQAFWLNFDDDSNNNSSIPASSSSLSFKDEFGPLDWRRLYSATTWHLSEEFEEFIKQKQTPHQEPSKPETHRSLNEIIQSTSVAVERLICQLEYLYQTTCLYCFENHHHHHDEGVTKPIRQITFERVVGKNRSTDLKALVRDRESGQLSQKTFGDAQINIHTSNMSEVSHDLFFDFANRRIHIHCITDSATQEEVLFSECPELFPSMWLCAKLRDSETCTEVVLVHNVRRYSETCGYLSSFRFSKPLEDFSFLSSSSLQTFSVLIADGCESSVDPLHCFKKSMIDRDLYKLYLGVSAFLNHKSLDQSQTNRSPRIFSFSTGGWASGVFGNDIYLKFIQQAIVATCFSKEIKLYYSTFHNQSLNTELQHILDAVLKHRTVRKVARNILIEYAENPVGPFKDFLMTKNV